MPLSLLALPVYILGLFFVFFSGAFLFWRAGRHELYDSELLLDLIVICIVGAFITGRFFEFFINYDLYQLSFERLIYFHVFWGFNWWGALAGAVFSSYLFLRRAKTNVFAILDLAAAPITFGQILYFATIAAKRSLQGDGVDIFTVATGPLLVVLYWIIVRFSAKRKRVGMIFGLWLVLESIISLTGSITGSNLDMLFASGLVLFSLFFWYLLSKRKVKDEAKFIFGFILLVILRFKRGIASLDDSGKASRFIIFLPYYILRLFLVSLKLMARELRASFFELMYVWGKRR